MYVRVFEYGKGNGKGPVNYVTHVNSIKRQRSPPQVLRGNPAFTKDLINSLSSDWKYTSGVLSWNHTDEVSMEQENEIMDAFEELAFAGLQHDQYNILWTRHTHADHHELHFVVPRVELYGGKSFNPCPPNWQSQYDPMRDYYNVKHNWHRPDNPTRRKLPSPKKLDEVKSRLSERRKKLSKKNMNKYKEDLIEFLIFNLRHGFVKNREDIINLIHDLGFVLNRKGKDYITPYDFESGIKFRLKGGIFKDNWSVENIDMHELIHETFHEGLTKEDLLSKLKGKIEEITIKRNDYNKQRYGNVQAVSDFTIINDAVNFDIKVSPDELSEQSSSGVKNDRNTKRYHAGNAKYRTREQSVQGGSAASIDESNTGNPRVNPENTDFGEQSCTVLEILHGFYTSIQGLIRIVPSLARQNRRQDLDGDESDLSM